MALPNTLYATARHWKHPASDQTDFVFWIPAADLPQSWYDLIDTSDMTKGRIATDNGVELASDWSEFDHVNKTGGIWAIWTGTLSSTSNVVPRVYPPQAANASYDATSTFGSQAVWVNYDLVVHGGSNFDVDAAGNFNNATYTTAPTIVTGKMGDAVEFTAGTEDDALIFTTNGTELDASDDMYYAGWVSWTTANGDGAIMQIPNRTLLYTTSSGGYRSYHNGFDSINRTSPISNPTDGVFRKFEDIHDFSESPQIELRSNHDEEVETATGDGLQLASGTQVELGGTFGTEETFKLDEFRYSRSIPSFDYRALEYQNQNDPTAFWGHWGLVQEITTVAEWNDMYQDYSGHYKVMNDLDFTGEDLVTLRGDFEGDINLNGHTLSNINNVTNEFGSQSGQFIQIQGGGRLHDGEFHFDLTYDSTGINILKVIDDAGNGGSLVENIKFSGSVTTTTSGNIVAYNINSSSTIRNVIFEMTINSAGDFAMVGSPAGGTQTDKMINNNTVTAAGTKYGWESGTVFGGVNNCFWNGDTVGAATASTDATEKTSAELQDITTFNDTATTGLDEVYDIVTKANHDGQMSTSIWFIEDGVGYPKLWFEYEAAAGATYEVLINKSSYAFSGKNVDPLTEYLATIQKPSYNFSGKNVDVLQQYYGHIEKSTSSFSGKNVDAIASYISEIQKGSYSLNAKNVDPIHSALVQISKGSYVFSGKNVIVDYVEVADYVVEVSKGSYILGEKNVDAKVNFRADIQKASSIFSGKNMDALVAFKVDVGKDSFSLSGKNIDAYQNYRLATDKGSYTLNGRQSQLLHSALATIQKGIYTFSGKESTLIVVDTLPNPEVLRLVSEIGKIQVDSEITQSIRLNSPIPED